MVGTNLLFTVGLLLLLLAAAGRLALRTDQSVVPAYILVGLLVGPNAPAVGPVRVALFSDPAFVRLLADLGVVLLLFFVGLELGLDQILAKRARLLRASAIDVGISLPLGFGVGLLFGFTWLEASFLALVLFNSSTVIIAKSLLDLEWIVHRESEAILGVIVVEDLVTAVAFAVLSVVLLGGDGIGAVARSVGTALGYLLVLGLAAYYGSAMLQSAFETDSSELFVLGVLGLTALVAGAGGLLGVSEAVVAFLVGTAFGRTGFVERIERLVAPSRDLFAAVFFFTMGVQADVRLLFETGEFVLAAAVVTLFGQLVSGFLAGRAYGLDRRRATRVGCALAPRGEFSLVIAAFLATAGTSSVLAETIPSVTVGYVLVTSVAGTVLMRRADLIERMVIARLPG